jgi:hypothetical protein
MLDESVSDDEDKIKWVNRVPPATSQKYSPQQMRTLAVAEKGLIKPEMGEYQNTGLYMLPAP